MHSLCNMEGSTEYSKQQQQCQRLWQAMMAQIGDNI